MISRCENPNRLDWNYYGGRNITVCAPWHVFATFLNDMGARPEGFTLDRINNNGNYEPGNCRWVSHKEQCLNRRDRIRTRIGPRLKDTHFVSGGIRHKIKRGKEVECSIPGFYIHHKYKYIGPMTKDGHYLSAGARYKIARGII